MREKLARFMYGRYGADRFSGHLIIAGLALNLLSLFLGGKLLYLLSLAIFIYGYFRVFSKNNTERYRELCAYESFLAKVKGCPARWKREAAQRKEYHIFRCPGCRQKIRIPRGRGRVEIRCPKCQTLFRKKS